MTGTRNWNVTGWKVAGTSPGPTWPRNPLEVVSGWKVAGLLEPAGGCR